MRFFFYGTMMDPDVRRIVLGAEAARVSLRPARLAGYRRVQAAIPAHPVLVRCTGRRVDGVLAEGLGREGLFRVAHFEGPEFFPRREWVWVPGGRRLPACVLLPRRADFATDRPWDFTLWRLREKRRLLGHLRAWMREYERLGGYSVDVPWDMRRRFEEWLRRGELED